MFYCQCYCECPHKSNAVMPLKRLLGLTTQTHTHRFSHFFPLSLTLLHEQLSTCSKTHTDVMCENEGFKVVCAHIRHSSSTVCLQFPLALVHSTKPMGICGSASSQKASWVSKLKAEHENSPMSAARSLFLCGSVYHSL